MRKIKPKVLSANHHTEDGYYIAYLDNDGTYHINAHFKKHNGGHGETIAYGIKDLKKFAPHLKLIWH
jgi:hypothetical protein